MTLRERNYGLAECSREISRLMVQRRKARELRAELVNFRHALAVMGMANMTCTASDMVTRLTEILGGDDAV